MRPASDTARWGVSPLLGESDDESEADRGVQHKEVRHLAAPVRRSWKLHLLGVSGDFGFGQFSRPHPSPDYGIIYPNVRFFEEENQEADRVQAGGPLRFAQKHRS